MSTNILGLNAYHWDASACLIRDGVVVAASTEERLGPRTKHEPGFPSLAVARVLENSQIDASDLDFVAVGYDPRANSGKRASYALAHPARTARVAGRSLRKRSSLSGLGTEVAQASGLSLDDCSFELVNVEHHLAHMASSFFTSAFDEAAGFTFDAAGDFVTTMYASCSSTEINVLDRVYVPNSLGYFYTALSQFIGFDHIGEEYKVMGLSAYGTPRYLDVMEEIVRTSGSGQFVSNQQYLRLLDQSFEELAQDAGEYWMPPLYTDRLVEALGAPRERGTEIAPREMDIAASVQTHFENVSIELLSWLRTQVDSANLVMAGGCALNGVNNARALRDTGFERMHIHCAATDDGLAIGAALWVWHELLGEPRSEPTTDVYLGSAYRDVEIEAALTGASLRYERYSRQGLLDATANLLNEGKIVGWFQGRYEWGPRALGNRSLLAHPGWPNMKDLINEKIKRRESFRPFAPSILKEAVPDYFAQNVESPFMMHVVEISEDRRTELAAVCHEDGTGRLHTVSREQNELYYDLIEAFGELSGTPVVLNTSFNENEPIVDTPEQAIATFLRNDVDVLAIGPFLVTKDSES